MKVTELRIGNIVRCNDDGTIFKIDEITAMGLTVTVLGGGETTWIEFDQFDPIPLTQKWLTDFGFVKEYNLWHNQIALYKGNPGYPFNYNVCFFEHHNLMTVFHVHQLQNLYFALTGTELLNIK